MAGRGKSAVEYDWLVVYNLASGQGEISYQEYSSGPDNDKHEFVLPSKSNQEKRFLKKELVENLSIEAKDIIHLIFNSPSEILAMLETKTYDGISKRKIKKMLRGNGWSKLQIQKTFFELNQFITELERI
jgi:hypothetical protein